MTTEYWLQKKTIGGWSMVTWYNELEQAQRNYEILRKQAGYSYRLVEVKTVQEHMLEDIVKVEAPEIEQKLTSWGAPIYKKPVSENLPQDALKSGGATWLRVGGEKRTSIDPIKDLGHPVPDGRGAKAGSVCLMHHGLKKRMRAMPDELDMLLSEGWERGGPRTQFRS